MSKAKMVYRPLGLVSGVMGGLVAAAVFKQVWRLIADADEAPKALESDYSWREILIAAAVQGAIFAVVKAAIDRGGARAFEQLTGAWPGD